MKELLPNAELNFYANWTHAPYISDPSGFARAIAKTVRTIDSGAPSRSISVEEGAS